MDLAVTRVTVWEMLENFEDVSVTVVIDEAILIVKSLSTDVAPSFVNAVLDTIHKDLEAPAWARHKASVAEDEPALDSEDELVLDPEDEGEEPTEKRDDVEDVPLSPELAEPSEEGSTDEPGDEELAELDELLDKC